LADVERENNILKDGTVLQRRLERIRELEMEVQQLRQQTTDNRQQTTDNLAQPDYEAIRDRTLAKLKMGRQSPTGKAIQAFIKELKVSVVPE
jgi:very-short-patch-repair endonuclease